MRLHSLLRRRPSASMIVASLALFVALGGAGYAATSLPANSVGTAQLKNSSVTNGKIANGVVGNWKLEWAAVGPRKIQNGAVGKNQINSNQVQARVASTCSNGAISAINSSGSVTCVSTAPHEFGASSSSPVTLGPNATELGNKTLPSGSPYLVFAYPDVHIANPTGQFAVQCTLSVAPSTGTPTTVTRSVSGTAPLTQTIPLVLSAASSTSAQNATVSCTKSSSAAAVIVDNSINAIQTASNN